LTSDVVASDVQQLSMAFYMASSLQGFTWLQAFMWLQAFKGSSISNEGHVSDAYKLRTALWSFNIDVEGDYFNPGSQRMYFYETTALTYNCFPVRFILLTITPSSMPMPLWCGGSFSVKTEQKY